MRCSKCGYISFDHLETCKKCHKSVNQTDSGLNGTMFDTDVPCFLRFTKSEEPDVLDTDFVDQEDGYSDDFQAPPVEAVGFAEVDSDISPDDEELVLNLDDIVLDNEEREIDENDEIILDLDDLEDAAPLENFSLEVEEQDEADELGAPTIDFGDLDISDLGPPSEDASAKESELELAPAALEGIEGLVVDKVETDTGVGKEKEAFGLEDLLFDELDLDKIDKATINKSSTKSLKTGTALDNFDVDLGELFTEDEQ